MRIENIKKLILDGCLRYGNTITNVIKAVLVVGLMVMLAMTCNYIHHIPTVTTQIEDDVNASSQEATITPLSIEDSVYSYIFACRVQHPHIVMAQCIEESGNFTSKSFIDGHNCTGMKVPSQRPTLCKGSLYGHACFATWQDCIMDYVIWQSIYCINKTEEEYFVYLDRVYAQKSGYSKRLKNIIADRGL